MLKMIENYGLEDTRFEGSEMQIEINIGTIGSGMDTTYNTVLQSAFEKGVALIGHDGKSFLRGTPTMSAGTGYNAYIDFTSGDCEGLTKIRVYVLSGTVVGCQKIDTKLFNIASGAPSEMLKGTLVGIEV